MNKILLLQCLPGFGVSKIRKFLIDNSAIISDDEYFIYLISNEIGEKVDKYRDMVKKILENCSRLDLKIIPGDFVNCMNPPLTLYIKGDVRLLDNRKRVGIVGTREPSNHGLQIGSTYIKYGVSRGWIIVSGMAKGCDTLAHKLTVKQNGTTFAVLPMGHSDNIYPWISENGLIISEYPPYDKIKKYKCVQRNRIISGLSLGIFVIEARSGSGSEHTIKFAKEKNIPVSYGIYTPESSFNKKDKIESVNDFDIFLNGCYKN